MEGVFQGAVSYLSEQEGNGSKGKRPAVVVAEIRLVGFGSVQHFVIDVGDVENQSDHQRETCETDGHLGGMCVCTSKKLILARKLTEPRCFFLCFFLRPRTLDQHKDKILYVRKLENIPK